MSCTITMNTRGTQQSIFVGNPAINFDAILGRTSHVDDGSEEMLDEAIDCMIMDQSSDDEEGR